VVWRCGCAVVAALVLSGCAASPERGGGDAGFVERPEGTGAASSARLSFGAVAGRYNERASRLGVVWARAVVSARFRDEDGDRRWEQGNGHLQVERPGRVALTIGKAGNVLIWVGGDGERYWLMDLDAGVAVVGRHDLADAEAAGRLGLAATPMELLELLGMTEMPVGAAGARAWRDGGLVMTERALGAGVVRHALDAKTYRPVRVELARAAGAPARVVAELDRYGPVRLPGVGGYFPRLATLVTVRDLEADVELKISLGAMEAREIPERVFDLGFLLEAYGPLRIEDADRARGG